MPQLSFPMPAIAFFLLLITGCGESSDGEKPNPYYSRTARTPVRLSDAEWKDVLPADVYRVARLESTDRPYRSKYYDHHEQGTYYCAACGNPLFSSAAKFESGTGWPSFYQPLHTSGSVVARGDADGRRTEVRCARCDAHLGHLFNDGPLPTGLRFCMNGTVLHFDPR